MNAECLTEEGAQVAKRDREREREEDRDRMQKEGRGQLVPDRGNPTQLHLQ